MGPMDTPALLRISDGPLDQAIVINVVFALILLGPRQVVTPRGFHVLLSSCHGSAGPFAASSWLHIVVQPRSPNKTVSERRARPFVVQPRGKGSRGGTARRCCLKEGLMLYEIYQRLQDHILHVSGYEATRSTLKMLVVVLVCRTIDCVRLSTIRPSQITPQMASASVDWTIPGAPCPAGRKLKTIAACPGALIISPSGRILKVKKLWPGQSRTSINTS
ncbi:hypothetical protein QBC37DRAFT_20174 [Rhypophila decipiens]|uniref:Uncharacterized protein n=1 Tax=Rhypophila decipiens TaxID=261697 RepID=A0AAN6Y1W5_9PEZI|nr:hypothetical protein QBC37DRAFT_20174 [Rhypophila decipiens]